MLVVSLSAGVVYVSSHLRCPWFSSMSEMSNRRTPFIVVINVSDSGHPPQSVAVPLRVSIVGPRRPLTRTEPTQLGLVTAVLSTETLREEGVFRSVLSSDVLATVLASVFGVLLAAIGITFGLVLWRRHDTNSLTQPNASLPLVSSSAHYGKSCHSQVVHTPVIVTGRGCSCCYSRKKSKTQQSAISDKTAYEIRGIKSDDVVLEAVADNNDMAHGATLHVSDGRQVGRSYTDYNNM